LLATGTPVAGDIFVCPAVQFKPVERDPLPADRNDGYIRSYQPVESIPVHAQVVRRIAETHQSRENPKSAYANRFDIKAGHPDRVGLQKPLSNPQLIELIRNAVGLIRGR